MMRMFSFVLWIFTHVPGFVAGALFSLCSVGVGLLVYLWCFHCISSTAPKDGKSAGPSSTQSGDETRSHLISSQQSEGDDDGDEAYQCGWVYVSSRWLPNSPPIHPQTLQNMNHATNPPKNIYFLVLKHNSLFFYKDEGQIGCERIVGVGELKAVDLYPHTLLLDEVYKKEFPLRLTALANKSSSSSEDAGIWDGSKKLYFWAACASEKEDWLFSLRKALAVGAKQPASADRMLSTESIASFNPLTSDPKIPQKVFMERLSRQVRNTLVCDVHSQWINAFAGRLFYNLFRNNDIERLIRFKFDRKVRMLANKPFFLGPIHLAGVSVGQSLPIVSGGKLHSISEGGEVHASVDVDYAGGFTLKIETVIVCQLPGMVSGFNVPVTMDVCVRRLGGRVLLRLKEPPSDRLWFGFYQPPVLQIDIEPTISTTRLSWSPIKTAIMSFIHAAIREYCVLPVMDDLLIPPLVIGDAFGGERPFEIDYVPPSAASVAASLHASGEDLNLKWSGDGISDGGEGLEEQKDSSPPKRSAEPADPRSELIAPDYHSPDYDLCMDSLHVAPADPLTDTVRSRGEETTAISTSDEAAKEAEIAEDVRKQTGSFFRTRTQVFQRHKKTQE